MTDRKDIPRRSATGLQAGLGLRLRLLEGLGTGWMLCCMEPTMGAALAYYRKTRCMIVIDRDGAGYEVAITRPDVVFRPSPTDVLNGEKLFGSLRMTSRVAEGF